MHSWRRCANVLLTPTPGVWREHLLSFVPEPDDPPRGSQEIDGTLEDEVQQRMQVQLPGNLCRDAPDCLQASGALGQSQGSLPALGDVVRQDKERWSTSKCQGVRGHFDLNDSPISPAVTPRVTRVEPCCRVCDIVEQSSAVSRRTKVLDGHTQEFSSGVAIVVYSGVIDGKKREGIKIVDPHGLWVGVEQQAVASFRSRLCL